MDPIPANLSLAKPWQRILAFLIDNLIILGPLTVVIAYFMSEEKIIWAAGVTFVVSFLYKPLAEATYGATIGKRPFGLKVVDATTFGPITYNQSFNRFLPWAVSQFATAFVLIRLWQDPALAEVTGILEFLKFQADHPLGNSFIVALLHNVPFFSAMWMFMDPLHRALHDRLAATLVVVVPSPVAKGWHD